jgi:hypothetical protein
MSDVISSLLIQIKVDATQAIQALKNVATGTTQVGQAAAAANASASSVSSALKQTGQAAEEASGHIRGLTYYFRSGMDSMRFALMGGSNPMAAFYALDEGIRAAVASGMELGTLVPVIGSVLAVIGAGALAWHEWNEGEREAAKNAKDLAEAWKGLPGIITQLNEMQEAGLLTAKQVGEYADVAAGRKKMYWDENHQATPAPTRVEHSGGDYVVGEDGIPIRQPEDTRTVDNAPMTRVEQQQWTMEQATAGGTVSTEYLNAVKEAKELIEKANEEALSGLEKQKAEIRDKYNDELQKMKETLSVLTASMSEAEIGQSKIVQDLRKAMTEKVLAEQNEIAAAEQAAAKQQLQKAQAAVDLADEQQRKQQEADKQHEAELQRQAQLTRDIQRQDLQDQIEDAKSNALMTDREKLVIITSLQQQQKQINDAEISELEKLKSQVKTLSDQLELEKKIAELRHDNTHIDNQPTPGQQDSFAFQWTSMLASQSDKWKGWAQESADSFSKAWDGATSSVSGGLTHLFEYGAQKGQWFREIWNGVVGSMISSVTKLAVDWVAQHVIMTTAHALAEQAMTAATAAGGSERGVIRFVETNWHNILVGLRVAAHVAGEALSTAATSAGAALRALYHAIAAAVGAMESESSVPYVGVILGIAAGAALMAAAEGMMGGFAAGGYTGDGHPSQIAGVVHAGEYVIPANRVNASTMGVLHAIRSGALAESVAPQGAGALTPPSSRSSAAPASAASDKTEIHMYFDKQKMVDAISGSDANHHYIVDVMAKNIHKFRS